MMCVSVDSLTVTNVPLSCQVFMEGEAALEGGVGRQGAGYVSELCVLSTQFCCESKTALKKKNKLFSIVLEK